MPRFFPPIHYRAPRSLPTDPWHIRRARSFFRPTPHSINVWILVDNTVTTVQPQDDAIVRRFLQGACNHYVSDAEAALLAGAGFETEADPTPAGGGYSDSYSDTY